jgi:hypothetical protein
MPDGDIWQDLALTAERAEAGAREWQAEQGQSKANKRRGGRR